MNYKHARSGWLWLLFLVLTFTVFALTPDAEAARRRRVRVTAPVGTQTCVGCHIGWHDNNPPLSDVAANNAAIDYLPFNFAPRANSFYFYPEGYFASAHATPTFNLTATDYVTCEACHGSGAAHFGLGPVPAPIPQTGTCISCHNLNPGQVTLTFDNASFLQTSHANPDRAPGIYFDQPRRGRGAQAKIGIAGTGTVYLSKADDSSVTKGERIEECSVCHAYALQYPQFQKKIANGSFKNVAAEVSCGACHDSHIPAPSANQPPVVNSTVVVAAVSGNTVTSVTSTPGRTVSYPNHKPYKIDGTGAQSTAGTWVRGSAIARPGRTIISGVGIVSDTGNAKCNLLTFPGGGFIANNVKPGDAVLISGVASNTVNLPAAAVDAGQPVTVQATLDKTGGYRVERVISDTQLEMTTRTETDSATNPVNAQLGTDVIAVVAKSTVTYTRTTTPPATGNVSVFVPFSGSLSFEIRDMYSNTEDLCGSCHTQGKYKYTAKGATKDGTPVAVDLASTHNTNVMGQYRNSGHGTRTALAFEEFTVYGGHQLFYPYDMSITGSGGVGTSRNKGNINLQLTPASTATNEYLSASGNTTLPGLAGSFACLQCHHGLASIDYQLNRHGDPNANPQVLWGDQTVTCITCHGPHENGAGSNIRVPVMLSFNSFFAGGRTNRMMDGTAIPTNAGKGIICLFCHQGRESGFTVFKYIQSRGVADPYATPTAALSANSSSRNSHYLAGGALLWSKNAYEFFFNNVAQSYTSGNLSHQTRNCTGCHMSPANAANTEGGHTWRPRIDGPCQDCHQGMTDYKTLQNLRGKDWDGDGTVEPTAQEIDGLIAQITTALAAIGIQYDPSRNPYFFPIPPATSITWTVNVHTASYNLNEVFKSANALYVHNPMYVIQVLRDSLQSITGTVPPGDRPAGDRDATDYRTITP